MDVSNEHRYMGFFTNRFVNAATPEIASASAIAAVRSAPKLHGLILNDSDDPPLFFVDEIEEVSELEVPEVESGFAFFEADSQSPGSDFSPPPYLVIRKGVAFWVENRRLCHWAATPQAFNEGCFRDTYLYDIHGNLWQISHAEFTKQPSIVNRLFPWRQLPVRVEIRPVAKPAFADILAELAAILESGNPFAENLDRDPAHVLDCLRSSTGPMELIRCAEKYE